MWRMLAVTIGAPSPGVVFPCPAVTWRKGEAEGKQLFVRTGRLGLLSGRAPMSPGEPRLFALNTVSHPVKGTVVGVIAKRTYVVRGGQCEVADEQVPLVEVPQVDPDTDALVHDMDIVLNRTAVDVIVRGKARAPGRRTVDVRVRVAAALDRALRVFGDRRCYRDPAGNISFSNPSPIEEIDVGWASLYGGVDEAGAREAR